MGNIFVRIFFNDNDTFISSFRCETLQFIFSQERGGERGRKGGGGREWNERKRFMKSEGKREQ